MSEKQEKVEAALRDGLAPDESPGALPTGWVLITEWVDGDGDPWLSCLTMEGMTTWKAKGMANEFVTGSLGWIPQDAEEEAE